MVESEPVCERHLAVTALMKGKLKSIHSMLMIFEMTNTTKKQISTAFKMLFPLGNAFAESHVVPGI
jgi:hypothetical protein